MTEIISTLKSDEPKYFYTMNLDQSIKIIKEEISNDNLMNAKDILDKCLKKWNDSQELQALKEKIDYLTRHTSDMESYKKEYEIYYTRHNATFSLRQRIDKWFRTVTGRRTRKLIKNVMKKARYKTIASEIAKGNYENILDVGCQDGRFCITLGAAYRNIKVTGIDITEANIKQANLLNKYKNVFFYQVAGENIDKIFPRNSFDLVMLFEILEHVIDTQKLIDSILNILKPGGLVAITVPAGIPEARILLDNNLNIKSSTKKLIPHIRRFDYEKLREMFKDKKDFKIDMITDKNIPSQYYYVTFKG